MFLLPEIMEEFPSESEKLAASGLLLLCSKPLCLTFVSSISPRIYCFDDSSRKILMKNQSRKEDSCFSDSKSCSSSLTNEGSSDPESKSDRLSVLALAAHFNSMKFKVVRKSRSKHYRNCDRRKNLSDDWRKPMIMIQKMTPVIKEIDSSREISLSSTLSNSTVTESSLVYESPIWSQMTTMRKRTQQKSNSSSSSSSTSSSSSPSLRRRAEAILKLLSDGSLSEVRIRQVLGDSPDTSKALRMLLKLEAIQRSGLGGPKDPYIYMVV